MSRAHRYCVVSSCPGKVEIGDTGKGQGMKRLHSYIKTWRARQDKLSFVTSVIISIVLLGFCGLAFYQLFLESTSLKKEKITERMENIADLLMKIDSDCGIESFALDKTPLNFFTVASFVGSEVGSLKLKHPDRWTGPYMVENPTLQGIPYVLIKSTRGYLYIAPGDGVRLSQGDIIGRDVILDSCILGEEFIEQHPALPIVTLPLRTSVLSLQQQALLRGADIME